MSDRAYRLSRRKFLAQAAALTVSGGVAAPAGARAPDQPAAYRTRPPKLSKEGRKPIATICTVYRPMSHAYHIAGRFILGYFRNGRFHTPPQYVHTLYVDQKPTNDLSREIAREHDIRLTSTIEEALTDGGTKLAVDGILLIGEHGNYPRNDKGQILYPRYEMMQQVVEVFKKTGQTVPVFNDKHLSYSWDNAKQMYAWAQQLRFPFMAGSSLPVVWRRPELELPLGAPVEDALVCNFGPIEVYGFHSLEALQVMVERRLGGETGVKAVTCLTGKDVWRAGDAGKWSWDLLEAALSRSETLNPGDIRANVGLPVQARPSIPATAFLIEYRDGLRGTVLLLNGHIQDCCFAARLKGEPQPASCLFYLPQPPGAKFFDCLNPHLETLFATGRPTYPVERTLLTSGILDAAMESHYRRGARVETPELEVRYPAPADSGFCRTSVALPLGAS
jgi:hypothetical protein